MVELTRKDLLLRAQAIRQDQARIRNSIRKGEVDPVIILIKRDNPYYGRIRLGYLLMSVKGIGKSKVSKILNNLNLNNSVRLNELQLEQVIRIAEELYKK